MKLQICVLIQILFGVCLISCNEPEWDSELKLIGKISPKHAMEISSSNWSIGAETMDRGYTIYNNWKKYLGPLGFKKARIQAGWARVEREKGIYDFNWLDEIIYDMKNQGVQPWVNLGYGNSIYADGGGTTLFGALPHSEEALEGWDNWVDATVNRYKNDVFEWEIWNEPNYKIPIELYADFLIRTAETVRKNQPEAQILAFGLGSGVDYEYAQKVLSILEEKEKLHLIDQVSFHRHQFVPEDYENVEKLDSILKSFNPKIKIRQTESGAPTANQKTKALNNYEWSEHTASKWALRRLMGDLGRDIESSYFGIMEMKYPDEMNTKGILKSKEDQTVERPKKTYHVLQHVASVFDDKLIRIKDYTYKIEKDTSYSFFAYEEVNTKKQLLVFWINNSIPDNEDQKIEVDLKVQKGSFSDPVYVDLLTGEVWALGKEQVVAKLGLYHFKKIPIYDSPVLIADRSILKIKPVEDQ